MSELKSQAASPARNPGAKLPQQILLGAILGIACGIFFGERAAFLQPIGDAYGAMLQIPVYPYLICSLMYGLGRLTSASARQLLGATWIPFLFLWILTLTTLWALARDIAPTVPALCLP